jgi:hypothetical protein
VVIAGASVSGAPSSGLDKLIWGKKGRKATVSTLKYSASKDLHYICNIIKERLNMWTGLQKCQNREKA